MSPRYFFSTLLGANLAVARGWLVATASVLMVAPAHGQLVVPFGATARIDGVIDSTEWQRSTRVAIGKGEFRAMHNGEYVYVAVTGEVPFLPTLCVASAQNASDPVLVLHASASLGTAGYRVDGTGAGVRIADFEWKLRDADEQSRTDALRQDHLARHGWVASTAGMNAGIREYQIRRSLLRDGAAFAVALVSLFSDHASWPSALSDDCASRTFGMGSAPQAARFDISRWGRFVYGAPRP